MCETIAAADMVVALNDTFVTTLPTPVIKHHWLDVSTAPASTHHTWIFNEKGGSVNYRLPTADYLVPRIRFSSFSMREIESKLARSDNLWMFTKYRARYMSSTLKFIPVKFRSKFFLYITLPVVMIE